MAAILTVLVVIFFSLLVVRVATVALVLTGVGLNLARFQARSAFTGTGYTTSESEQLINHPVRRRIIMMLMLAGNAGIVSTVAALIIGTTVQDKDGWSLIYRIGVLLIGMLGLWVFSSSRFIERRLNRIIAAMLKRYTSLDVTDYATLLHVGGQWGISEVAVAKGSWMAGHALAELRLSDEGVLVLGVQRGEGNFIGVPRGTTEIHAGDTLIAYGAAERLRELQLRRKDTQGVREHYRSVVATTKEEMKEKEADER